MHNFFKGFRSAFSGFSLLRHKGLRWFVLLPILLSILFFSTALWFGYNQLDAFTSMINNYLPNFLSWLDFILVILISPLLLIICFYISTIAANIIAAPFNALLAEKVETLLVGYPPPSNGRLIKKMEMVIHIIACELGKLIYLLLFTLPLIILSFVPVINIVMPFVWLALGSWLLCVEYMDYPMGNHNIRFSQQLSLLKQHKNVSLGFGFGLMLITSIPVINLLAMPVATCSAGRLWVDYFSAYYRD